MKALIIIPAYNESDCIQKTVESIVDSATGFDYVVVNDCSTDNTLQILKDNHHGYDYAVQVDGDGQHDVSYLRDMLEELQKQDASMVIGSRFIKNEGFQSTFMRRVGITYFTTLIRMLTGKTITDPTSGFRLVNRDIIERFAFDYPKDYPEPESVVAVLKRNKKVVEVPVKMRERQGGVSSIRLTKSVYYMIKVTLAILIECTRKH